MTSGPGLTLGTRTFAAADGAASIARQGRAPAGRVRLLLTALAIAVVAAAALASSASAALTRFGPIDPNTNFPSSFVDSNGLALTLCIDGAPNCLADPDFVDIHLAGGDAEAFYYAADADVGPITVHNALEAAYAADGPNQEVVFMRTQISDQTAGTLTPGGKYTITDPYGVLTCTADSTGQIRNNACRTETTPVALDFARALNGRIGPFLTWDTFGTTGPGAPPAGYIGDNATPHTVVGSPTNFNKVRIQGPSFNGTCTNPDGSTVQNCAETDKFIVQGKVEPGVSARTNPAALDFGNLGAGSPVTKTITYTSTGNDNAIVSDVQLGGTNPTDFSLTQNCTTPTGIAPGGSCAIDVSFTPREGAVSAATVTITDNTTGSPRTVKLSGSSLPAMTVDRTSIPFGSQKVGTTSPTETVVVGNTGVAPLTVSSAALGGTGATHFKIASNGCTAPVAPDGGCEIEVAFAPTTSGSKTASLNIKDASGTTKTVALTGTGTSPTISVSATALAFPDTAVGATSASKSVTFTNGGTAAFTIDGVAFTGTNANQFKLGTNTCSIGTNVAPGSSCVVQVAFAPTTTGAESAALEVSADGAVKSIALTGTGAGTLDTTKPTVSSRSPAVNATAIAGTSTVTATFSEAVTGVSGTTFTLKTAAGTAVTATVAYNATTHVATLTPSAALANDTKYTAALTTAVKDTAGNALAATSWSFTTGPRPTVTTRTPASGATAVANTSTVTATFSEDVTGVSGTTFTLKTAAGAAVTATVAYNATTHVATLTPSAALANDTKYTAALTAGIKDAAGNPITATSWSFTTGPKPTVTARTPAANATAIARTTSVTATFSEAVTGVSTTTFTLKPVSSTGTLGTAVTATVTYNATTRVATLVPSAALAANTKYTAGLTTAIKDSAGNPLGATSWSFTTGA